MMEIFKNKKNLLGQDKDHSKQLILGALNAAIDSVLPETLIKNYIKKEDKYTFKINNQCADLLHYEKVIVVGGGKAGALMAEAIEKIFGESITEGRINIPKGTASLNVKRVVQHEATHPIPSAESERGARLQTELLKKYDSPKTLVIVLISGGISSLECLPAQGITLEDKIEMGTILLEMGVDINKVNAVRKHISAIKGGQLVRYAGQSRIISLIISDVIGSELSSIGSGLTVPDPTTFKDAYKILKDSNIIDRTPKNIVKRFEEGIAGKIADTPKPGDPLFANVSNILLADNAFACRAAVNWVKQNYPGYNVEYLGSRFEGEASDTATKIVKDLIAINRNLGVANFIPRVYVWGGETTVTVRGKGKGGRNQEQALAALIALGKSHEQVANRLTLAFFATDGIDRVDAAGAIVNRKMYFRATVGGINIERELRNNNSNPILTLLGGLLRTGPTGVNNADMGIAVFA